MRTTLNLLTRDGAVYMSFQPALSAKQYGELLELTHETITTDEMQKAIAAWAAAQGLKVSFNELDGD
jgi:hypothetical protein